MDLNVFQLQPPWITIALEMRAAARCLCAAASSDQETGVFQKQTSFKEALTANCSSERGIMFTAAVGEMWVSLCPLKNTNI